MKIYQVHLLRADNGSRGYSYHVNKVSANRASKEYGKPYGEIHQIEVSISKVGIVNALNTYAGHPIMANGQDAKMPGIN